MVRARIHERAARVSGQRKGPELVSRAADDERHDAAPEFVEEGAEPRAAAATLEAGHVAEEAITQARELIGGQREAAVGDEPRLGVLMRGGEDDHAW